MSVSASAPIVQCSTDQACLDSLHHFGSVLTPVIENNEPGSAGTELFDT